MRTSAPFVAKVALASAPSLSPPWSWWFQQEELPHMALGPVKKPTKKPVPIHLEQQ